ncbi:hypothetical protein DFH06DRAFT_1485786 [Mycena polygramma]|nr:hypothetical protein DFH06DRAFT_1485786 [Mycena polygramma]
MHKQRTAIGKARCGALRPIQLLLVALEVRYLAWSASQSQRKNAADFEVLVRRTEARSMGTAAGRAEAERLYVSPSMRSRSCGAPMQMSLSPDLDLEFDGEIKPERKRNVCVRCVRLICHWDRVSLVTDGSVETPADWIFALFWMPSYALRVHSCEDVVWSRRKAPNLYVVVYQDGRAVHRTNAVKRNRTPQWDDICSLPSDSPITLRLWHDCLLRCRDICLGAADTEISALLDLASSDTEYNRLPLTSEDRGSGKHTGTVLVCLVRDGAAASTAIEQSKQNIGQLAHVSALMETAGMVDSSQPAVKMFEAGLGIIITKLNMIIQIGNEVAKIHPYANMAWKILTSVYQAVKAEQETQEKLKKLVDIMVSVYSFTEETDALPQKIKSLENAVLAIVKQTIECAVFIREYTGHGFTARVTKNTWDNADKTIDDLCETLLKLKDSLEGSLTVHGLFLSAQVLQKVDRLGV